MYILDRIENGIAVIEADGEMLNIPAEQLPNGAKEGDVLRMDGESISVDEQATASRKEAMRRRLKSLFQK